MFDVCVNIHSEQFDKDRFAILERAKEAQVTHIALIGSCLESTKTSIELCRKLHIPTEEMRYITSVGIHPHHAKDFTTHMWEEMTRLADDPFVKAIGECGLDYNRNFSTPAEQRLCFIEHIHLAKKMGKPLFLHQRDAITDFLAIIDDHATQIPKLVHCFTDGIETVEALVERGCYIGITGWIADDRRNASVQEAIHKIPLDRLVIETDAPWLIPRNMPRHRKIGRNEPSFLPYVVDSISQCLDIPSETIIEQSTKNARNFFAI